MSEAQDDRQAIEQLVEVALQTVAVMAQLLLELADTRSKPLDWPDMPTIKMKSGYILPASWGEEVAMATAMSQLRRKEAEFNAIRATKSHTLITVQEAREMVATVAESEEWPAKHRDHCDDEVVFRLFQMGFSTNASAIIPKAAVELAIEGVRSKVQQDQKGIP